MGLNTGEGAIVDKSSFLMRDAMPAEPESLDKAFPQTESDGPAYG